MTYVGERKVKVTVYTDVEKVNTRVITQTFKTCDYTIDKCRDNLTKQIKKYSDNPYIVKVIPVSEYFYN